VRFMDSCSSC